MREEVGMEVKKKCHSERLLLIKRRDWRSCFLWKETQEPAMALTGGWAMRKEQHKLYHVGQLQQRTLALPPVLSLYY